MRFAHFSDCHIGGWREEDLRELSLRSFERAIALCIEKKVDFVVIAGDLFNTALPAVEALKEVTTRLKLLQTHGIRCYLIPGSHDFSPSGKTMIDVLEKAGLCVNVFKQPLQFTVDQPTGTKLIGIPGLKQGLEKYYYADLDREMLERESGFKIFLFHTLLTELRPKGWEQVPGESVSLLPKHFNYYAGGHPHFVLTKELKDHGLIAYPGPLFPNNFKELEELKTGGFFLVDVDEQYHIHQEYIPLNLISVLSLSVNADQKTPREVHADIKTQLSHYATQNTIVTVRIAGTLASGSVGEIGLKALQEETDCYAFLLNTYHLESHEFTEVTHSAASIEEMEAMLIQRHCGQLQVTLPGDESEMTKQLFHFLQHHKLEGETNADFEARLMKDIVKLLQIQDVYAAP